MVNKILIASDHAGFDLKQQLIKKMPELIFDDLGTDSKESVDYTDYANELSNKLLKNSNIKGVLICGTGVGMSIAANKFNNIRAGLVYNSKVAKLIREHNDANILVLPGKYIDIKEAIKSVDYFIKTSFEGGRHINRINKMMKK
tara:strand:- start:41 stop:472 length:432 start_codon:yes stop_codon:yes gene_type:complete